MKADIIPGLTYLATRNGDAAEDIQFFKKHPIYDKQVLDSLQSIFDWYVFSTDSKKLAKIGIEGVDAFQAFAVLCLRHTIGAMTWRVKHCKFNITDFFSISDEGIALVILENNAKVWKDKAIGLAATASYGRYMDTARDGSVRKLGVLRGKCDSLCCVIR
jgi:hypothetical protein